MSIISNKRLTEVTTTYYLPHQDGKPVELSRSEGEKNSWMKPALDICFKL